MFCCLSFISILTLLPSLPPHRSFPISSTPWASGAITQETPSSPPSPLPASCPPACPRSRLRDSRMFCMLWGGSVFMLGINGWRLC